jgi:hypothetical protein
MDDRTSHTATPETNSQFNAPPPASLKFWPSTIAELFLVGAAVTYASGFLVLGAFLDRLGIRESGLEFIKIKYIQIGILFLLFPGVFLLPVILYISIRILNRSPGGIHPARLVAPVIILVNALLITYVFATFAHPAFFYEHIVQITCLFIWTTFCSTCSRRLSSKMNESSIPWVDEFVARYVDPLLDRLKIVDTKRVVCSHMIVYAGIVVIDWWILDWKFSSWAKNLDWASVTRALFYYFLCFLSAGFLVHRFFSVPKRREGAYPTSAWLFVACVSGGLWYMSIFAFAYGVYPHIPVVKGGGDYATTPDVELYFKKDTHTYLPKEIILSTDAGPIRSSIGQVRSIRLKVIEETAAYVFVADPKSSTPRRWQAWQTPKIYAVDRTQILSIAYSPETTNVSSPTVVLPSIESEACCP